MPRYNLAQLMLVVVGFAALFGAAHAMGWEIFVAFGLMSLGGLWFYFMFVSAVAHVDRKITATRRAQVIGQATHLARFCLWGMLSLVVVALLQSRISSEAFG